VIDVKRIYDESHEKDEKSILVNYLCSRDIKK